jgi:hypothetical protein
MRAIETSLVAFGIYLSQNYLIPVLCISNISYQCQYFPLKVEILVNAYKCGEACLAQQRRDHD